MQTQGWKRILLVAQQLSRGLSPAPQTLPCEAGLRGCEGRPPLQLPAHRPCLRWEPGGYTQGSGTRRVSFSAECQQSPQSTQQLESILIFCASLETAL